MKISSWKCKFCGATNSGGTLVCKSCGKKRLASLFKEPYYPVRQYGGQEE